MSCGSQNLDELFSNKKAWSNSNLAKLLFGLETELKMKIAIFKVCLSSLINSLMNILAFLFIRELKNWKQLSKGVLKKRCSENMQQIYGRTPMFFTSENMN